MKHLFSFLALFVALQLNGQLDYQSAQKFVNDAARFWANPQNVDQLITRGAITHSLDSIVSWNGASVVTEKAEMEYNDEGLTTIMRQYLLDSLTGSLQLDGITAFAYQAGNLSNLSIQELNPETQELVVLRKWIFSTMVPIVWIVQLFHWKTHSLEEVSAHSWVSRTYIAEIC